VSTTAEYHFRVSAPKRETFAWLYGRAESSGEILAVEAAERRFTVGLRGHGVPVDRMPVAVEFAVRGLHERASRVRVSAKGEASDALALIEDFARPLGDRWSGVRTGPPGFFKPPLTQRDKHHITTWIGLFVCLLGVAAATRSLPPEGVKMTGAQLVRFLLPIVAAALAAGIAGGFAVRRGGRWYEPLLGGLAVGWLASYVVFDVWFNSMETAAECATHPCDLQAGFGAAFFALPEAAIMLCGVLLGRAAWGLTRVARRAVSGRA
jgi:hypothetical protein